MSLNFIEYYKKQSELSNPGKYKHLFEELSGPNIPELMKIIQNVIIPQHWIIRKENYGVTIKDIQATGRNVTDEMNLRSIEDILGKILEIENKKLTEKREPINRIIGNCRDYALLLTSI